MELNDVQKGAAAHFRGPCMVLAGPGAGKTLTIAGRIRALIKEYKTPPENILVVTFTRRAAKEMEERFLSVMGEGDFPVMFGTFHSIYYHILRSAYGFTSANIFSEGEKRRLLLEICRSSELNVLSAEEEGEDFLKELLLEIGRAKNSGLSIDAYKPSFCQSEFQEIYSRYEAMRKSLRKIDFDDMLILCRDLLLSREDILKEWRGRFRYILADEFQDINAVQYETLKMLALPENNLFVVGDDDQSIYGFRGAKPEIMLGFRRDYPRSREFFLNVNYRSAGSIVNGALRVISHNRARYKKELRAAKEKGEAVRIRELKDDAEEGGYIAGRIKELRKENVPFREMAVLFRTNLGAGAVAEALLENKIPFYMREYIPNIYGHFIAGNIKSYFRLAMGERDRKYFLNIINCPKRYISRESMERPVVAFEDMQRFYSGKERIQERIKGLKEDIEFMEGSAPYPAIQYIRKKIGYDDYLKEYAAFRGTNYEEYAEILSQIEEKAREFKSMEDWFAHIKEHTKALEKMRKKEKKGGDEVSLTTIHGAKGLEFDAVFLPQSNEGVIPYKKAKEEKEIEEERRLFYVGMTRARKRLFVSYVKNKNGKEALPSRFIKELSGET